MSDLLPCPFCGANLTVGKMNVARCKTDGCALEHYSVDLDWKERVDAWNRRAIPATDARAEALKEAAAIADDFADKSIVDAAFWRKDGMPKTAVISEQHAKAARLVAVEIRALIGGAE